MTIGPDLRTGADLSHDHEITALGVDLPARTHWLVDHQGSRQGLAALSPAVGVGIAFGRVLRFVCCCILRLAFGRILRLAFGRILRLVSGRNLSLARWRRAPNREITESDRRRRLVMLIAAILHADGDQPADLEPHHDASNYIFNIVGRTAEVDHHRRIFQEIGRIGGLLFEPGNKVRIVDILKRHHQDRE